MIDAVSIADGLIWRPFLPPLQVGVLGVLLTAAALYAYLRSFSMRPFASIFLLLMRLAIVVALTALMFGPSHVPEARTSDRKTRLTVMLDVSESMLTEDCQGASRITRAQELWMNRRFLDRLAAECDVQLVGFAKETRPLSLGEATDSPEVLARGRTTRLAESVNSLLARQHGGESEATMLVISDGHDTEDASILPAASLARSKQIPVHTVLFGGATVQQDLAVLAVPMQEYLLPGEPGALLVKVYQFGMPDARTTVRLKTGGKSQEFPIDFRHRKVVEFQVDVQHDEEGQYEYEVLVDPTPSESESSNNRQAVFCEVQRRRMKVLLLEGQPYWDTKFLAQSLRKDERIELTQITQVSDDNRETIVTRVEQQAAKLPRGLDEWAEYDVVIAGRGLHQLLDARSARELNSYVIEGGGNLVFARGRCYDPDAGSGRAIESSLRRLESVTWGDQVINDPQVVLTATGRTSNWLAESKMGIDVADAFRRLKGFESIREIRRTKSAALVLAEAHSSDGTFPALTAMQIGRGKVVALLGEGSWQWSLLAPDIQEFAQFYDVMWSNLVRWMVVGGEFRPGEQVSLRVSRQSARLGDELSVDVVFKQPAGAEQKWRMDIHSPDGSRNEVSFNRLPGQDPRFRATLDPKVTGVHELTLHTPGSVPELQSRRFNVYDMNVERLETSARPAPLQILAEHSGGRALSWDRPGEFLDLLKRQRVATAVPPDAQYIWDTTGVMILMLVWCGSEWIFRRLAGLL